MNWFVVFAWFIGRMNCFGVFAWFISCFSVFAAWFMKRRSVDNPLPDVRVDDNDLALVNDTLQDLTLVDDNIAFVHSPISLVDDHPSVNDVSLLNDTILATNPTNDHPAVNHPVPSSPDPTSVHIPRPDDLTANDYPLPDLTLVKNPLVYHPSIDNLNVSRCVEKNLLDLPNHIIIEILLRFTARCVFRCQRASKLLEILSTTPFFIRTHFAQSTSVIALQCFSQSTDREIKFYFIGERDKKVEEANLKLDFRYIQKDSPVMLYDSCDGFLLLKNKDVDSWRSILIIWNPATEEQVTITMEGLYFQVCGFYFNPHNKEYEVLLLYSVGVSRQFAVDILSLKSKLHRNIGRYSYMPRSERCPTIINGILYWLIDRIRSSPNEVKCSNLIMAFEIRTNKFSTMGHGGVCEAGDDNGLTSKHQHMHMHLLEMEGKLGLCVFQPYTYSDLVLWVLNPATNSWTKVYYVTFPVYSMPKFTSCWPNSLNVEVVKIGNGKLLVRQEDRLLLCDLNLGTHEIVEKKGFEDDIFRSAIHTSSLVSLGADKLIHLERY